MRVPTTFLALGTILASGSVWAQETDWQQVDAILGRKPAVSADVHRYGFPRTDLSVTLDGVAIKPALALGGWVFVQANTWRRDDYGRPRASRD